MTYLQRNRQGSRNGRRNKKIVITAFILLVLILVFAGGFLKGAVNFIGSPISKGSNWITSPFVDFFDYIETKNSLIKENEELKEQVKRLNVELLTTAQLKDENSQIKNILEYGETPENRFLAKVIRGSSLSSTDSLIVDEKITKEFIGQPVFHAGVLIGKVSEVYFNNAMIKLFSSSEENISVIVSEEISAEASGMNGGKFSISVPKDIIFEVGELVTDISGEILGVIEATEIAENDTFGKAYFSYPFELKNIDWVEIQRVNREE